MNILLVDDHSLFREGMKYLLKSLESKTVITEADSCEGAIELLSHQNFDLILLDLNLPGKKHMAALAAVKNLRSDIPIVVFSGEDSPSLIRLAIDSGAMGFIPKSSSHEILILAMRLVLAGGVYLPSIAMQSGRNAQVERHLDESGYSDGFRKLEGILSDRQLQVLRLIVEGKSNREIGEALFISENTVKTHVSAVMRALNTTSRTETVYYTAMLGMTSDPITPHEKKDE